MTDGQREQTVAACSCGEECELKLTDCCGEQRPECETTTDEDLRLCQMPFGCWEERR